MKITTLQLSLEFQNNRNKESESNTGSLQITKRNGSKSYQNTVDFYKSTSLEKIRNLNYDLASDKHIKHSSFTIKPDKSKTEIEEQIEELKKLPEEIEELKKLTEEEKEATNLLLETVGSHLTKTDISCQLVRLRRLCTDKRCRLTRPTIP